MRRLILALLFALPLYADEGAAILAKVDAARNPLNSFAVDVSLTSISGKSTESSKFRVYGKGNDRSVVEFVAPATEKGKYLLMLRDAMWIYMPSTSRPIRISPLQRLMGQASNGDVARTNFAVDYSATSVASESDAWVLDLVAKDTSIAYARIRLWVDKKTSEPSRADFYVVSGKLIKRALYAEHGQRVEIEDLLRPGNRTVMQYANLAAHDNPEKMFTKDSLGKW
jgi:outer membrane lipoprotein-sorting protein